MDLNCYIQPISYKFKNADNVNIKKQIKSKLSFIVVSLCMEVSLISFVYT